MIASCELGTIWSDVKRSDLALLLSNNMSHLQKELRIATCLPEISRDLVGGNRCCDASLIYA